MEPDFMDRVGPVIDETIRSLARKKFIEDPIAGDRHSRNTSISNRLKTLEKRYLATVKTGKKDDARN